MRRRRRARRVGQAARRDARARPYRLDVHERHRRRRPSAVHRHAERARRPEDVPQLHGPDDRPRRARRAAAGRRARTTPARTPQAPTPRPTTTTCSCRSRATTRPKVAGRGSPLVSAIDCVQAERDDLVRERARGGAGRAGQGRPAGHAEDHRLHVRRRREHGPDVVSAVVAVPRDAVPPGHHLVAGDPGGAHDRLLDRLRRRPRHLPGAEQERAGQVRAGTRAACDHGEAGAHGHRDLG